MKWVMELSRAALAEYTLETVAMDPKTERAYWRLATHLRLYGSAPTEDRVLAAIMGVTPGWLRSRAWPLIKELLAGGEDGRLYHPDVQRLPLSGGRPAPVARSPRHQAAALVRWGKPRPNRQADLGLDASGHASPMQPDAKMPEISMSNASGLHANSDASASSDASAPARARTPPLSEPSSLNQLENCPDSLGGRGIARACVDASTHADASDLHAPTRARAHRVRAERDAPAAPIPADWTPSLAGIAEAKKRGFDPVDIAEGFKLHYQKTGKGMANWDAAFVAWCRRQTEFDRARQGGLPMAVQGGGTAPAAAAAPVWSETIAGQVATVEAWVAETPELAVHLQAARTTLRSQISEADYHAWLLPMALAEVADGEVTMTLPTLFKCDWVRANYADRVLAAWRAEIPTIERVEFLVRAPPAAATG